MTRKLKKERKKKEKKKKAEHQASTSQIIPEKHSRIYQLK